MNRFFSLSVFLIMLFCMLCGAHSKNTVLAESDAYDMASKKDTIDAYSRFIHVYPGSDYSRKAWSRICALAKTRPDFPPYVKLGATKGEIKTIIGEPTEISIRDIIGSKFKWEEMYYKERGLFIKSIGDCIFSVSMNIKSGGVALGIEIGDDAGILNVASSVGSPIKAPARPWDPWLRVEVGDILVSYYVDSTKIVRIRIFDKAARFRHVGLVHDDTIWEREVDHREGK